MCKRWWRMVVGAAESLTRKKTKTNRWFLTKYRGSWRAKNFRCYRFHRRLSELHRRARVSRLLSPCGAWKSDSMFAALHRGHFVFSSLWTWSRTRKAKLSYWKLRNKNSTGTRLSIGCDIGAVWFHGLGGFHGLKKEKVRAQGLPGNLETCTGTHLCMLVFGSSCPQCTSHMCRRTLVIQNDECVMLILHQ